MSERNIVVIACSVCKNRNYYFSIHKKKSQNIGKLLLNKFCKSCKKHTMHKETK
ncbi:MAG: 50S ribosomal protein L33 [Endomicrobium sp.]|jgi:large subunit ribosomal protein L33|nr:50S ribosomal protein L33 [Endomicrobium sp.]